MRSLVHQTLIAKVAAARHKAGISQRALAAKLKRSESYVSKFEAGERRLEVCEFLELCAAIGADPLALLGDVLPAMKVEPRAGRATAVGKANRRQ